MYIDGFGQVVRIPDEVPARVSHDGGGLGSPGSQAASLGHESRSP